MHQCKRNLFLSIWIVFPFLGTRTHAQQNWDTTLISMNQVRNSTSASYFLADSFSIKGDSIHASECFLKINPYYLMINGTTIENLDKELSKYLLTADARNKYKNLFVKTYNTPQTEVSKKLMEMYLEDQSTRYKFAKGNDSLTNAVFEKQMMQADSIHFKWLYNYVQKNGWPTMANGSGYASIIVLHDPEHFCYYLPYLKKAVFNNDEDYKLYNNVLRRCRKPSFEFLLTKYKYKISFDISYALKGKEPTEQQLDTMRRAVKDHLPIKYIYIVYESKNKKNYLKFLDDAASYYKNESYWIMWRIAVNLVDYQRDLLHLDEQAPFSDTYSETIKDIPKLKLYLLY